MLTEQLIGVLCYFRYTAISNMKVLEVSRMRSGVYIHRGSDKPRFQYRSESNENLMYIRAIQGHSGGVLVDPE